MALAPEYDVVFYCNGYDSAGNYGKGFLNADLEISGEWIGIGHVSNELSLNLAISATYITSENSVHSGAIGLELSLAINADLIIRPPQTSWVRWSDIGNLDFTINRKNLAGEAPMPWAGLIYGIMKLGKSVVVYGSGGVTQLVPIDNNWSPKNIHFTGLLSNGAFCGNDNVNLFVDKNGTLFKITDKLESLDYSEFLSTLTGLVMSYDNVNDLAYMCNGTSGYVYSVKDGSLGKCSPYITGISYVNGLPYVIGSNTISRIRPSIATDIFDANSRGNKTIRELEIGTSITGDLEACIEFRLNHKLSFTPSPWFPVTQEGRAFTNCFGKEFKFKIRTVSSTSTETFKLDYLHVKGRIHDFRPEEG